MAVSALKDTGPAPWDSSPGKSQMKCEGNRLIKYNHKLFALQAQSAQRGEFLSDKKLLYQTLGDSWKSRAGENRPRPDRIIAWKLNDKILTSPIQTLT